MSTDFDPEQEEKIREQLSKESIRPPQTFAGAELWPMSKGAHMIYNQVTNDNSTIQFCALALVYILTKRSGTTFKDDARRHLCGPAWDDLPAFRSEIIAFRNTLSDENCEQAIRILDEEMNLGLFSQVAPVRVPPKKGQKPQKKTQSGRRTNSGSASRSRKR